MAPTSRPSFHPYPSRIHHPRSYSHSNSPYSNSRNNYHQGDQDYDSKRIRNSSPEVLESRSSGSSPRHPTSPRHLPWTLVKVPQSSLSIPHHFGCIPCFEFTQHLAKATISNPLPEPVPSDSSTLPPERTHSPPKAVSLLSRIQPDSPTAIESTASTASSIAPTLPPRCYPCEEIHQLGRTVKNDTTICHRFERRDGFPDRPWVLSKARAKLLPAEPSPILTLYDSIFKTHDDFYRLDIEDLKQLSEADSNRFAQFSCNVEPVLRTSAMEFASKRLYRRLWRNLHEPSRLHFPYGLPEQHWRLIFEWIRNPASIPFTVGVDDLGHFNDDDVYLHIWISSITANRNYHHINLLIALFMKDATSFFTVIDEYCAKDGWNLRTPLPDFMPWQFSVSPRVSFHGAYKSLTAQDVLSYGRFIIEIGHFPINNLKAINQLVKWANTFAHREAQNHLSVLPPEVDHNRRIDAIIDAYSTYFWADDPINPSLNA